MDHPGSANYNLTTTFVGHRLNDPMWPWDAGNAETATAGLANLLPTVAGTDVVRVVDTIDHRELGYCYDDEPDCPCEDQLVRPEFPEDLPVKPPFGEDPPWPTRPWRGMETFPTTLAIGEEDPPTTAPVWEEGPSNIIIEEGPRPVPWPGPFPPRDPFGRF